MWIKQMRGVKLQKGKEKVLVLLENMGEGESRCGFGGQFMTELKAIFHFSQAPAEEFSPSIFTRHCKERVAASGK
jgi:hypothetical protein